MQSTSRTVVSFTPQHRNPLEEKTDQNQGVAHSRAWQVRRRRRGSGRRIPKRLSHLQTHSIRKVRARAAPRVLDASRKGRTLFLKRGFATRHECGEVVRRATRGGYAQLNPSLGSSLYVRLSPLASALRTRLRSSASRKKVQKVRASRKESSSRARAATSCCARPTQTASKEYGVSSHSRVNSRRQ